MPAITIRDISEDDNQRLKQQAELKGLSLQRFLRDELHSIAQRTPLEQAQVTVPDLVKPSDISVDMIVAAIRKSRDKDET